MAAMFEGGSHPGPKHDRLGFFEACLCFRSIDTETSIAIYVVRGIASEAHDQWALRQMIHRDICSAIRTGWWSTICARAKPIVACVIADARAAAELAGST